MSDSCATSVREPLERPIARSSRLSHPVAFSAITAIFVLFTAASSAPSPLYVVYQREWGFSATTLTVVFAVYVVGLIGSLLVVGALSDHVGRRPVLAAAIALEAVALVLFITANDVPVLLLARVAQGIATGAAMTTLGATLVDLNPPHAPGRAGVVNGIAPTSGLAVGALGCGVLVQFAPAPTRLVYALLLGGMALAALIVAGIPETSALRQGGWASLTPRLGVPARLRPDLYSLLPILVASWALGGLYLSLGPSVAVGLFGLGSHLVGGLVVTLLCGTAAVTAFALRSRPTGQVLSIAAVLLTAGTALALAGVEADSVALAALGTVIAGIGFGASALACFGELGRLAAPDERGELFAVVFVIAYLAFSLPAVAAGLASTSFGLHTTTVVYSLGVVALGLMTLGIQRVRSTAGR
ncbi:MFS transporter [Actinacidiphila oryziradicis]|uniref:MFS transporter n=1 Tax=Actinacidiphila oryziradicis TaxID=2571141 RepID=UPI0023F42EE7|nr:MFS transporter [Actinacidiphila oryziradicis]MCW2872250.1 Multidrug resistance protein mdtL [Actinacidiphila oryziradicis]